MKRTILVAEDEPSIALSVEFLLRAAGYEVAVVRDGEEALQAAAAGPELIVLDIMLPRVNGVEVCRRIRENDRLRNSKILMLTARGRQSEVGKCLALGADAFMIKPFATRELVDTVNRLLAPSGNRED